MTIQQLKLGDSASHSKTISETDVYLFAGITGDLNPAHVNESVASASRFGGRIAHGILSAGLISAVLAMQLPGPGTIYLGQELKFTKPVRFGDTVTATCTVSEIDNFFRIGISVVVRRNFVFNTCQYAKFAFYSYIKLVSVINYLLSQCYVFFVRKMRTVNHH